MLLSQYFNQMGHNLISVCHKCKVKIFHFRNEEHKTILPFYKNHANCAKEKSKIQKVNAGFMGYDWMLEEIFKYDRILEYKERKELTSKSA